jgi:hypothetical protein
MTYSLTVTESHTFTVTHARHMAAKVATDLKRIQRFYGYPSDELIAKYEAEAIELIKHGFLESVAYGFKKNGNWIEPTLRYTARDLAGAAADDHDPGRVRPGANIEGASFTSHLTYSASWFALSSEDMERFKRGLPFSRGTAPAPGVTGYFADDLTYSAGGRALSRASVKSFQ